MTSEDFRLSDDDGFSDSTRAKFRIAASVAGVLGIGALAGFVIYVAHTEQQQKEANKKLPVLSESVSPQDIATSFCGEALLEPLRVVSKGKSYRVDCTR